MQKKDIYLATVIGFIFGVLLLLPMKNIGLSVTPKLVFLSVFGFAVFAPLALFVLYIASRFIPALYQFGKFAAVGALNTLIDLGVLNFLIILTDVSTGVYYSFFKAVSFLAAVGNSYFWNKFWTFESKAGAQGKEFVSFVTVSFIGVLINTAIVYLGAGLANLMPDVSAGGWINLVKILATVVSLVWNFLGYKFFVFKKPNLPMKV